MDFSKPPTKMLETGNLFKSGRPRYWEAIHPIRSARFKFYETVEHTGHVVLSGPKDDEYKHTSLEQISVEFYEAIVGRDKTLKAYAALLA
jgi:hypothetical protein